MKFNEILDEEKITLNEVKASIFLNAYKNGNKLLNTSDDWELMRAIGDLTDDRGNKLSKDELISMAQSPKFGLDPKSDLKLLKMIEIGTRHPEPLVASAVTNKKPLNPARGAAARGDLSWTS